MIIEEHNDRDEYGITRFFNGHPPHFVRIWFDHHRYSDRIDQFVSSCGDFKRMPPRMDRHAAEKGFVASIITCKEGDLISKVLKSWCAVEKGL